MGLYKITSRAPLCPNDVEAVIVNAVNDSDAVEIATSPEVMPVDRECLIIDRARWVEKVVVEYLGMTFPSDRPEGVIAVERVRL